MSNHRRSRLPRAAEGLALAGVLVVGLAIPVQAAAAEVAATPRPLSLNAPGVRVNRTSINVRYRLQNPTGNRVRSAQWTVRGPANRSWGRIRLGPAHTSGNGWVFTFGRQALQHQGTWTLRPAGAVARNGTRLTQATRRFDVRRETVTGLDMRSSGQDLHARARTMSFRPALGRWADTPAQIAFATRRADGTWRRQAVRNTHGSGWTPWVRISLAGAWGFRARTLPTQFMWASSDGTG